MENLCGKTALVTGASKRIGREMSMELARSGINVVVHYNQSQEEAKKLCYEIINLGVMAWPIQASFNAPSDYETWNHNLIEYVSRLEDLDMRPLEESSEIVKLQISRQMEIFLEEIFFILIQKKYRWVHFVLQD